jgi:FAD dependent oxidoreductase TIGR03364
VTKGFDLAVVGAGILGLAHAYAAAKLGKRVLVLERDAAAAGASVRNFGFVTVTGQQSGACWRRARRSAEVWAEIAPKAGIHIVQRGLLLVARRAEARAVVEEFCASDMGEGCRLLAPAEFARQFPELRPAAVSSALLSTRDLRVQSRLAIPRLAAWLGEAMGVSFRYNTHVREVRLPTIETSGGAFEADAAIVCPNDERLALYPQALAEHALKRCRLQMLRAAALNPPRLSHPLMSDLSLVRYLGFAELASAGPLLRRLKAEQAAELAHGIHLIATQDADGSLIIGDSHDEDAPAYRSDVEALILQELSAATGLRDLAVSERWMGSYPIAQDGALLLVERPEPDVRIVIITSGTGASTGFAIAEEVIGELYGRAGATP